MLDERSRGWQAGLLAGVAFLIVVLHPAHLTGLRNTLAAILAVWSLAAFARKGEKPPLIALASAWILVGLSSAAWSLDSRATLKSVLYDIVLPFGGFYAAYLACRRKDAFAWLSAGVAAGTLVLLGIAALAFGAGQPKMLIVHDPSGIAYYFPGPNPASTLVVYAVPFALVTAAARATWLRALAFAWLACIAAVGLATESRMFWLAAVGALAVYGIWYWKRLSPARRWLLMAVLAAAAAAALATASYLTAKRATYEITKDIRLDAWREWSSIAAEAPLLGYGLGKKVLTQVGASRLSQELLSRDAYIGTHAHNIVLNVVLQVGVAGLLTFIALLAALLRLAYQARHHAENRRFGAALAALIAAMLVKNATDDLMDHAVVVAFWLYAGVLAGRLATPQR